MAKIEGIKDFECKYCHKIFHSDLYTFMNHIQRCVQRPNVENIEKEKIEKRKLTFRKHFLEKVGETEEFKVKCYQCGKEFSVFEPRNLFPKKEKYFCSSFCSHSYAANLCKKEVACSCCGHIFLVNKNKINLKNVICKDCKKALKEERERKKNERIQYELEHPKKKIKKPSKIEIFDEDIEYYNSLQKQEQVKQRKVTRAINYYFDHHNYKCQHIKLFQCWFCGRSHCSDDKCYSKVFNNQSLSTLVKYFGFDTSKLVSLDAFKEIERIKNTLISMYYNQEMSVDLIAKHFNVPITRTVYNIFKYLDIPRRSFSEAILVGLKNNRGGVHFADSLKYQFHTENHKTWNNKEYLLRSSNEIRFAEKLDVRQINYEVETLRIEYQDTYLNRKRIAIPDFYIPSSNDIYEIKSDLTLNVCNMIDKFNSYKAFGYIPHLILNDEEVDLYSLNNDDYQLYKIFEK